MQHGKEVHQEILMGLMVALHLLSLVPLDFGHRRTCRCVTLTGYPAGGKEASDDPVHY